MDTSIQEIIEWNFHFFNPFYMQLQIWNLTLAKLCFRLWSGYLLHIQKFSYSTKNFLHSLSFRCVQKANPCHTRETSCLHQNPKTISTLFTEINNRTLPVRIFDIADRSTATDVVFTNSMNLLHAKHPVKGPIVIPPKTFRLDVRRYLYHTTVTIIASGRIEAPMDVRLALRRNAMSSPDKQSQRRIHIYDTVSFINVFITSDLTWRETLAQSAEVRCRS